MRYYSKAERETALKAAINKRRDAAALCIKIKPILQAFDEKVYNVKLERALKEAGRMYIEKRGANNRKIYINACVNNEWITLAGYDLPENKRINANEFINSANAYRESLLKEAAEIEAQAAHVETYAAQIETLKKALDGVVSPLNYTIREIYGLNYHIRNY